VVGRRRLLTAAVIVVAGVVAAAVLVLRPAADRPGVAGPPPGGLRARLDDETQPARADLVSWRTFWELCWDDYPGAVAYELRAVTGEGVSPHVKRQKGRCLRIEAASGETTPADEASQRTLLLAEQRSELAYQVRAVTPDHAVSEWTPAVAVGEEV
jgi:hypothetical protein